jgi:predicted O-linked N-acetylglucosamine transferase (SPINDLY family)
MSDAHSLTKAAAALREGRHRDAIRLCDAVLRRMPADAQALHVKALALHLTGEPANAATLLERAIALRPRDADLHGNLGRIRAALGDYAGAAESLRRAVQLAPDAAQEHADLATALCRLGRFEEGALSFQRALALRPGDAQAMLGLARARVHQSRTDEARQLAAHAASLAPALSAKAQCVVGLALLVDGRSAEAEPAFARALELDPDNGEALLGRARAAFLGRKRQEAKCRAEEFLRRSPGDLEGLLLLADIEQTLENMTAATLALERVPSARASDFRIAWRRANLLPPVAESHEQMAAYRAEWRRRVAEIAAAPAPSSPAALRDAAEAIQATSNIALHYHGEDDRADQELYGAVLHRVAAARFPALAEPPERRQRRRPRIGFLSQFLRRHSIWKTHSAWITGTSNRIEKYVYYPDPHPGDEFTEAVRQAADLFVQDSRMDQLIRIVAEHKLDALVYLDHGMAFDLQLPAALWLAPVQCNGLGHPITSGLPTFTHALSSELMEPAEGARHYSERLVMLPNSASCYRYDRVAALLEASRPPVREDGRVRFLSSQNPQKYLPRYDHLFATIARELPAAEFHFIESGPGATTFRRRLEAAFTAGGLDASEFCRFHGRLQPEAFFTLNLGCDAFLDSIGWSGNNTAHEAIACGLPIVTLPGALMRSRHCLALLRLLGLEETIARSVEDYVTLALRLGRDAEWRRHLREETLKRRARLFDDPTPLPALERFLLEATGYDG